MKLQISSFASFLSFSETKRILDSLPSAGFRSSVTSSPFESDSSSLTSSSHISLSSLDASYLSLLHDRLFQSLCWPASHIEPLHIVRYVPGEQYKPHHDDFPPIMFYSPSISQSARLAESGNRLSTALLYLNSDFHGGNTYFPALSLSIEPKAGMLVAWDNLFDDGSRNPAALHSGVPILSGVKYIIPVHLRERPFHP